MGGGAGLAGILVLIVGTLLAAQRHPRTQPLFRWLPFPLWCYALPVIAVTFGWLPKAHPVYRLMADGLLPIALALLLFGVDLPVVARTGTRAFLAAIIGAAGIIVGAPLWAWIFHGILPPEAWKGIGALAGTWTGGSMNLLALRAILQTPDAVFAPLIVVDAVIAYSWMVLLVLASAYQEPINRWLRATGRDVLDASDPSAQADPPLRLSVLAAGAVLAILLVVIARGIALRLPPTTLISSISGWTVLIVTTVALALSLHPACRRIGRGGIVLGYPCLYLVLAAVGAQADLRALWAAPAWLLLGLGIVAFHGAVLLLAGRAFRLPLGLLATASQANIGGVVSAPMVGAVYHRSLAPVGLVLAMAGNALGTYLGLLAATLARALL